MRRRPSGSSEEQDASTPPEPPHGDTPATSRRSIEQDTRNGSQTITSARPQDNAQEPHPPGYANLYSSSPSPAQSPHIEKEGFAMAPPAKDITPDSMVECHPKRRAQLRNPWACSPYTILATLLGFAVLSLMVQSFLTRQLDTKGCEMSYMRPAFAKFADFDTEHTRFASKYSLYLYREGGVDEDLRVRLPYAPRLRSC
jgi:hypothetical protein